MRARTPFPSRFAALLLALLVAMHLLVTLDLFFRFFPATAEFVAMWSIPLGAKMLWAATCAIGIAAVFLLYRHAWLGFIASAAFCVSLYFASLQLWGAIKGGFWLAVGVAALALVSAMRPSTSSGSGPPSGSA